VAPDRPQASVARQATRGKTQTACFCASWHALSFRGYAHMQIVCPGDGLTSRLARWCIATVRARRTGVNSRAGSCANPPCENSRLGRHLRSSAAVRAIRFLHAANWSFGRWPQFDQHRSRLARANSWHLRGLAR